MRAVAATVGEMTCLVSTRSWPGSPWLVSTGLLFESSTRWIPIGLPGESAIVPLTSWPSWASVSYAWAISIGVTPFSSPPRMSAGL